MVVESSVSVAGSQRFAWVRISAESQELGKLGRVISFHSQYFLILVIVEEIETVDFAFKVNKVKVNCVVIAHFF